MDLLQKVQTLGESAQYDLCGARVATDRLRRDGFDKSVYPAALPDGKRIRVLKVLLTNICEKRCGYCGIRASRSTQRSNVAFDQVRALSARKHGHG